MQDLLNRKDSAGSNEFDLLDEPSDNKKFLFGVFALVIFLVIGFTLYYFIIQAPQQRQEEARQAVLRTPLLSPAGPLKEIPENSGGLEIPNQDKQVFETIESQPETDGSDEAESDNNEPQTAVLPAPEQPQSPQNEATAEVSETPTAEASAEPPEEATEEAPQEIAEAAPQEASEEVDATDDGKLQITIPTQPSPEVTPEVSSTEAVTEPSAEPSPAETVTEPSATVEPQEEAESVGGRLEIRIPTAEEAAEVAPEPETTETAEPSEVAETAEAAEATGTTEIAEADVAAEVSPEPSPETSAESSPPEAVAETGDFIAQLAALQKRPSAETVRDDLLRRFPQILTADNLQVESGQASDGSEIFRVQTVLLNLREAQSICATLQQNGLNCFVRRGR